jgi:hypothetical protein
LHSTRHREAEHSDDDEHGTKQHRETLDHLDLRRT